MSSKFESALKNTLNDEVSVTENGAIGFASTKHKLLDIHFAASSLRNKTDDEIRKMFSEAFYEDKLLALKWLFMLRDCRSGLGERRSFKICFKWLASTRPDIAEKLISLVPTYGRWDDLFCLVNPNKVTRDVDIVEDEVIKVIDDHWANDVQNMKAEKPVSLLAKWMPRVNTSSPDTVKLGRFFAKKLGLSERAYRKTLANLCKKLNVTEQKASAKQWSEINYESVPSKANIKYKNAFLKHDEVRRREYLSSLEDGTAKINASVTFPSDIVHSYSVDNWQNSVNDYDHTLESMWKSLPDMCINGNVLAVVDGSGSMKSSIGPGALNALEVANALGLYCAEHLTGPFKNKFITFSEKPHYVDFSHCNSLREKLKYAYQHDECANTDIEKTFDLVLKTAVDNNLKQEDIPTLVILSDMEFDIGTTMYYDRYEIGVSAYSAKKTALMECIRQKWADAGYKLPRLVWWNIASRTNTVPMQDNETGCIMCSGYSQNQFKMILSNKTGPYEVLVETLNDKRYQAIEDAVKTVI